MLCFLLYSKPCSSTVAKEMVVLEHPLSGVKDSGQLCGPDVKVASTVASGDGARKHAWLDIDEMVNTLFPHRVQLRIDQSWYVIVGHIRIVLYLSSLKLEYSIHPYCLKFGRLRLDLLDG